MGKRGGALTMLDMTCGSKVISVMNKNVRKRIIVVILVVGMAILFKVLGLEQYFTLAYIKASQARSAAVYADHRLMVIAAYMAVYILVTSLSLPGAAIMTLAAGALFGLLIGTIVVSFASTIGATLACFISRFVLQDWVQGRFGNKLKEVNDGIAREGTFYLFTLRLIPVFPFWLINLIIGLTKMSLRTFYWVSQVGMLAGTMVYVNAGKELAKIDSLSGILSPGLIISFALLGLFPLIVRKVLSIYKIKKKKNHSDASNR